MDRAPLLPETLPLVAIVGRPNVGKSTLFNRLAGRRLALVDDRPGVTRDRREGEALLHDLRFRIFDTAGLEEAAADSLADRMTRQTQEAVGEADAVLFVIDARAGLTPQDEHFARWLRRVRRPVIVVANKAEARADGFATGEAFKLGLGAPLLLSAEHGQGLDDLHEALLKALGDKAVRVPVKSKRKPKWDEPEETVEEEPEDGEPKGPVQLAIVGRPNVGKSTLVNRLLGEERLLTGPEAGITRDAIAIDWSWRGQALRLVDTAGLRRRGRVEDKVEKLAGADTRRAIKYAQVVVLVVDAAQPLEKQDLVIAEQVIEEGRALVIAVNKWDAVDDAKATLELIRDRVEIAFPRARGLPVVTVSALRGNKLDRLLDACLKAYEIWNRRIRTADLNRWLEAMVGAHPPPAPAGRRIRLKYMTQVKARPPTFALFASQATELPTAYLRYLENGLREHFDLPGTPIRIVIRGGRNPYDKD
jgi:GTP-binding protein